MRGRCVQQPPQQATTSEAAEAHDTWYAAFTEHSYLYGEYAPRVWAEGCQLAHNSPAMLCIAAYGSHTETVCQGMRPREHASAPTVLRG